MSNKKILIAILEDHQSIIDGYIYRINADSDMEVVATAKYANEIDSMLAAQTVHILLLGVHVPISASNTSLYPISHVVSNLAQKHPQLNILIISMDIQPYLIESLMEAGVSGYISKDDSSSIKQLPNILRLIAEGGIYFSPKAYEQLRKKGGTGDLHLSPRQLEVLSLCAAYPDDATANFGKMLGVSESTIRNVLSGIYIRLGVHTRAAAIDQARKLGLLPNNHPDS